MQSECFMLLYCSMSAQATQTHFDVIAFHRDGILCATIIVLVLGLGSWNNAQTFSCAPLWFDMVCSWHPSIDTFNTWYHQNLKPEKNILHKEYWSGLKCVFSWPSQILCLSDGVSGAHQPPGWKCKIYGRQHHSARSLLRSKEDPKTQSTHAKKSKK